MRSFGKVKVSVGMMAVVVIAIFLESIGIYKLKIRGEQRSVEGGRISHLKYRFLVSVARSEAINYQVGELTIIFPQNTDWQIIKADKNELILKMMTFEPVVRRYEFITHELITVSYHTSPDNKHIQYLSMGKAQLTNILGLLTQEILREEFEIGEKSSFIKVAGVDAYRFELIKRRISPQEWLKGGHIRYAWHIVVWKKNWYLITYSNFDDAFPGAHFSDFKILLKKLKFVESN